MPDTQAPAAPAATNIIVRPNGEVLLYGVIGDEYDGLDPTTVISQIDALGDVSDLVVRIDSPGGYITPGMTIFNYLSAHPARITVRIDGMAASMASVIAMVGDQIIMPETAIMMIHNPATMAWGESDDLRTAADYLDKLKGLIVDVYARRTGQDPAAIAEMMDKTTFMTAQEAFDLGFCTAVESAGRVRPDAANPTDLARFGRMPERAKAHFRTMAATAAVNSMETAMDPQKTPAAPTNTAPTPPATPPAASTVQDAEARGRQFVLDVRAECRKAKLADDATDKILAEAKTMEQARAMIIDAWASMDQTPEPKNHVRVEMGTDAVDKWRTGVEKALLMRSNIGLKGGERNEFTGMTLRELARNSLEMRGVKLLGVDPMAMAGAALNPMMAGYHSSSDFTHVLANVANKAMLKGYEEAGETFQQWTGTGTLTDFKPTKRIDLNLFPALSEVPEGAEYKYATVGDRGETVQLATYGRMFSITRQAIINDDMDVFTRVPLRMGRAAIRTVGNLVYAVLTGNQTMADGVALFHADHDNLAASGAVPSTATFDAARTAMGIQKDPDGHANGGLNISPRWVLVPKALEGASRVVVASEYEVNASAKNNTTPNSVRGMAEVIAEARLDAASATAYYFVADAAMYDTIEVSYLDGMSAPVLEQQMGWNVDGVEMKVRMDAGVKALDFRTFYKNPGA